MWHAILNGYTLGMAIAADGQDHGHNDAAAFDEKKPWAARLRNPVPFGLSWHRMTFLPDLRRRLDCL